MLALEPEWLDVENIMDDNADTDDDVNDEVDDWPIDVDDTLRALGLWVILMVYFYLDKKIKYFYI